VVWCGVEKDEEVTFRTERGIGGPRAAMWVWR
jgi:hypothetical protein